MIWKIAALILAALGGYAVLIGALTGRGRAKDAPATPEECRKCGLMRDPRRLCACEIAPTP